MEKSNTLKYPETIPLRDLAAIEFVICRAKKERRSKAAALALIVLEWAEFKSIIRRNRQAARRTESLPEHRQDTAGAVVNQQENPAAETGDAAAVDPVEKAAGNGD